MFWHAFSISSHLCSYGVHTLDDFSNGLVQGPEAFYREVEKALMFGPVGP